MLRKILKKINKIKDKKTGRRDDSEDSEEVWVEKDAVPDQPRNNLPAPVQVPRSDIYRNHRFNTCSDEMTNSLSSEREFELSHSSDSLELNAVPISSESSNSVESSEPGINGTGQRIDPVVTEAIVNGVQNHTAAAAANTVCPDSKIVTQDQMQKKPLGQNFYFNQCQNFHIGQRIEVSGSSSLQINPLVSENRTADNSELLDDNFRKISTDEMWIVAQNVNNRWKSFGLELGVTSEEMETLAQQNTGNVRVAVYEMLRWFVDKYPDTSIGYVVRKLKICGQQLAVRRLAARAGQVSVSAPLT